MIDFDLAIKGLRIRKEFEKQYIEDDSGFSHYGPIEKEIAMEKIKENQYTKFLEIELIKVREKLPDSIFPYGIVYEVLKREPSEGELFIVHEDDKMKYKIFKNGKLEPYDLPNEYKKLNTKEKTGPVVTLGLD